MCKSLYISIVLLAASTPVCPQTYKVLHHFGSQAGTGIQPEGTIAQARNGAMLTTTSAGGGGSALRIGTDGHVDLLHTFVFGAVDPGNKPEGGLILATGGQFYGTTSVGGVSRAGTVFAMSSTGTISTLYDFTARSDGTEHRSLIQSSNGYFFGTYGNSDGGVYRITKTRSFTLLHAFTSIDGPPGGPLVQGTDDYFYGTTTCSGAENSYGTIFRLSSSGQFKVLVKFNGTNGACFVNSGLIEANDGNFYGVTSRGGSSGHGVLFRMTPSGVLTVLHNFTGGSDGAIPWGGLVQASDGNLYGANTYNGKYGYGVLFRASLAGDVVPLHDFTDASGRQTRSAMLQHTNGVLYGNAALGGGFGGGVFFSLDAGLPPFVTYLPVYGRAGAVVQILGQGFTSDSVVSFNGTRATFKLVYPTYIQATVPEGATTGPITVTTATGTLTSNKVFMVHMPAPTTTLQGETTNNTSAADSFAGWTSGNARVAKVSKLPLQHLLYSGSNTKIYATWMGWFGNKDHKAVGYNSNDPAQIHRQVEDMISRGINGVFMAWYGPGKDSVSQLLKTEAEAHSGQFEFAIMEDVGALNAAAKANNCDVTDQLISDLTYVASEYESSPAYLRMKGRPVVLFFSVDTYYIDWGRVASSIPGNPLFLFRGTGGFKKSQSNGGFSWVDHKSNDPFDTQLGAQDDFYNAAQQVSGRVAIGAAYKGFNDTLATWGSNRIVDQHCGQTWLQTFSELGKFYSSGNQLPALQIVTWNDYEEGTAIEPGIDNCVYLTPSQSGATVNWAVKGGDESTIDHYTVFISTDGTQLSRLGDVPRGTHAFDLSRWSLPSVTYSVYVEAVGEPSIQNKMSPAINYRPGHQPPSIQLKISQTGPLTYTASTTGSSGNIVNSIIDFGDGTGVNGTSASHTYPNVGRYLITATVYDSAGASSVAVQQLSAKPQSGSVEIAAPGVGSTVNWPTTVVASAGTPASAMRVLIDGQPVYAAYGDTLNTALKVFTGPHQLTVQALDSSGNATNSTSLNVVAEPGDLPPVARITITPMPAISPTTVLGCTATSTDADGFLMTHQLQYSDGHSFSTQAALEKFPAPGMYTATATVMDQFGATNTTSTPFSVGGATAPAALGPISQQAQQEQEREPIEPMPPE